MALELVTMSTREIDVLDVIRKIHEQRLTQVKAGELLGLSDRQVRRLCARYERDGAAGLVSRQRGRPSNHRLPNELCERSVAIVRERYADFGPQLAQEKLLELHDIRIGRETLRKWMAAAGLWVPRRDRQTAQADRDRQRLASKKLTKREKSRIAAARDAAGVEPRPPGDGRFDSMVAYLKAFDEEQKARQKLNNVTAAFRRRVDLAGVAAPL